MCGALPVQLLLLLLLATRLVKLEQKKIGTEYPSKEDVIVILKIMYSTHHNVLNRSDKGQVIY